MTMFWTLMVCALIMKCWPETGTAKWLHRHLVERPIELAERADRRTMLAIVIMLVMCQGAAMFLSADLAFALSLDYATVVDAAITVWTVAAVTRSKAALAAATARIRMAGSAGLRMARARARRSASVRPVRRDAANDDEGHGVFALAA